MKTIYLDMDGTIAMFYAKENCLELMYEGDYFKFLTPYVKFVMAIKDAIKSGVQFKVISACVTEKCKQEKADWLDAFLPEISAENRIFCNVGENKSKLITNPITESVLIDDYSKNCIEWEKEGGIAVKFINEINGKGEKWKGLTISYDADFNELVQFLKDVSV